MSERHWPLADPRATEAAGTALARVLSGLPPADGALVISLSGELGAGKTTLVRGLLRCLGVQGAVKSPSYTLVEPYQVGGRLICHLDLYRIGDPEELEFLGLRDYLAGAEAMLVEWPERAKGVLPAPDLVLRLAYAGTGRDLYLRAGSARGEQILNRMMSPDA